MSLWAARYVPKSGGHRTAAWRPTGSEASSRRRASWSNCVSGISQEFVGPQALRLQNVVVMRERSVADAWWVIRSLRASPPGKAQEAKRKLPFSSALEQAEQLWDAAQGVGIAARPILLYYGLVQAGMALAISRSPGAWAWSGHGLRLMALRDLSQVTHLRDITVTENGSGGFQAVAALLSSATFSNPVALDSLWLAIPEGANLPLPGSTAHGALTISFSEIEMPVGHRPVEAVALVLSPAPDAFRRSIAIADVKTWLSSYPTLAEAQLLDGEYWPVENGSAIRVRLKIEPTSEYSVADAARRRFATAYGWSDSRWVAVPAVAGNSGTVHPLLSWWVLLYSFSMLARYYPASWATMTDIDSSDEAVRIERMLDVALFRIPDLLIREFVGGTVAPSDI